MAGRHSITGRHFHKQVFQTVVFKDLQKPEIVGDGDKAFSIFPYGFYKIKILVTSTRGYYPGQVCVALRILYQKDGPPAFILNFAPDYGFNAHFFGRLDEKDQAIEAIDICQGQPFEAQPHGYAAQLRNGGDAPTPGIMGMDIQVNKRHKDHL
jgi:hypothetical protein